MGLAVFIRLYAVSIDPPHLLNTCPILQVLCFIPVDTVSEIVSIEPAYYEETGWHIYLKMWKKPDKKPGKKKGKKAGGKKK